MKFGSMRDSTAIAFTKSVVEDQGGVVVVLEKRKFCENCRKVLTRKSLAIHWVDQSKVFCQECACSYLENGPLLKYMDGVVDDLTVDPVALKSICSTPLGRLAVIVNCEDVLLSFQNPYFRSNSDVRIKAEKIDTFILVIKSVNYGGKGYQDSVIRLLAAYSIVRIFKYFPALFPTLLKLVKVGDRELQLAVLQVLPSISWGRSEKLQLIGSMQAQNDKSMLDALAKNMKRLGINNEDQFKMAVTYQPMVDQLMSLYTAEKLRLLHNFIFRYVSGASEDMKKANLAFAIVRQMAEKQGISALLTALPSNIQKLINMLIWSRVPPDYEAVENELYLKLTNLKNLDSWSREKHAVIKKEYSGLLGLVETKGNCVGLIVNSWLKNRFKMVLPKPESALLKGREQPPDVPFANRIEYNSDFVALLPNLVSMYQQKNISLKANGMPSVAGCKKMVGFGGGYTEFFPDHKQLRCHRSELIFHLLKKAAIPNGPKLSSANVVKTLLESFLQGGHINEECRFGYEYVNSNLVPKLMPHLEWAYYNVTEEFEQKYLNSIKGFMKAIPKGRWVTVSDLLEHLFFNSMGLGSDVAIDTAEAGVKDRWGSKRIMSLEPRTVSHFWEEPLIKTFLLLFAAIGVVEICVANPVNSGTCHYNKEYLSRADGVIAVRLSPLGEWYFQGGDESCFKKLETGEVVPDDKRLLLHLRGNDLALRTALEQTAHPVGGGFYSIDSATFLNDCKTEDAVVQKMNAFKSLLPNELPEIWQAFFDKTLARLNPLAVTKISYTILELKNAPELKQHLLSNQSLRKLILLAEGGLILVAKKNILPLKKKLAGIGFYVDSF